MIKKLIILNLALLALVALLAHRLNADLKKFRAENNINKIKAEATANAKKANGKKAAATNNVAANTPQPAPLGEYQVVVDKNLFSENRTVEKEVPVVNKPQPPELNPKPNLYGVIEDKTGRWALIEDNTPMMGPPAGPPTGPHPVRQPVASSRKSIMKLKLGDSYRSYKVTEISNDRVTLTYGNNEKIEYVPLFDKNKPKPMAGVPGSHPIPPPPMTPINPNQGQVVTIGSSTGAKPGTPGAPGQAGGVYQPPQLPPGAAPGANSAVTSIPPSSTGASSGTANTTVQPGGTTTKPATPPTNTRRGANSEREVMKGGKKYIRTPFGDVPQDNQ